MDKRIDLSFDVPVAAMIAVPWLALAGFLVLIL